MLCFNCFLKWAICLSFLCGISRSREVTASVEIQTQDSYLEIKGNLMRQ